MSHRAVNTLAGEPLKEWNFNREPKFQVAFGPKIQMQYQSSTMTSPEISHHQTVMATWDLLVEFNPFKIFGIRISNDQQSNDTASSSEDMNIPLTDQGEQLNATAGKNARKSSIMQTEHVPSKEQTPSNSNYWRAQFGNDSNQHDEDRIEYTHISKMSYSSKESHKTLQNRTKPTQLNILEVQYPSRPAPTDNFYVINSRNGITGVLIHRDRTRSDTASETFWPMTTQSECCGHWNDLATSTATILTAQRSVRSQQSMISTAGNRTGGVLTRSDHIRSDKSRDTFWPMPAQSECCSIWNKLQPSNVTIPNCDYPCCETYGC